jgi:hypothetical protein
MSRFRRVCLKAYRIARIGAAPWNVIGTIDHQPPVARAGARERTQQTIENARRASKQTRQENVRRTAINEARLPLGTVRVSVGERWCRPQKPNVSGLTRFRVT